jgi:hypothetical protein
MIRFLVLTLPSRDSGLAHESPSRSPDAHRNPTMTVGQSGTPSGAAQSCTWVAIHPNIPSPTESRGLITLHRVKLVVFALIVPESNIVWAIRQQVIARDAQRRSELPSFG